jgi:hypothetical protein
MQCSYVFFPLFALNENLNLRRQNKKKDSKTAKAFLAIS